ncbi:NAD-dependent epimerase/dehydratase family protein [Bosea caraganae]|uniref:NAD-dependent epimerase/dehydratase family protein n=1 Tax=Bosea caraganae TaxID=2763117 RepID=A0A370L156_9HYPH|nr:NmrA family NAD(P)-binding protein [Bosea caraganae]RDJ21238.1 NAD-dependent epimerase/dehydratase family protein [Bosea caraganae]RDJ26378.1 NAD-dependent epimerase/dehydratase family protein [Bosea caraganae]
MYAITGITGQVGGAVARSLLAANQPVRAVLRDAAKAAAWSERGCEVALADIDDEAALTAAFTGAEAVFVLIPSMFDPSPGFPEARAVHAVLRAALATAGPGRVLCLSTIGAQAAQENLLSQHGLMERTLGDLSMPICFLRPGWFIENAAWDVAPARENGVIQSFLQPLDKPVPMVATADIGRVAAGLLQDGWSGRRVVELEGPDRVTPNQIAAGFAHILGRPIRAEPVPRETWEALFRSQGMQNPLPRARMLDGFNQDWIAFEGKPLKGAVGLETVLRELVARAG